MPDQHQMTFRTSLVRALEVGPSHITIFPYRPTPGTVWGDQIRRGLRKPTGLAFALESHDLACEVLGAAGFVNYMVTAFQKSTRGHIPRGPAFYYATGRGDYIGLGCGGLSILGNHRVESCTRAVQRFISDPFAFDSLEQFSMDNWETIFAIIFMSLGTDYGLSESQFEDLFGIEFEAFRHHPRTEAMLAYYKSCGAELRREPDGRHVVSEATRARAYLTAHLASAYRDGAVAVRKP
jgi:oxygen-independent coproporphyrinogen-3 oxidase